MSLRLILASASPRRRELMAALGLDFAVVPADVDERAVAGSAGPAEAARLVARANAAVVAAAHPGTTVLAADTIVVSEGRGFGKPEDAAEAGAMLAALRARRHEVITAVCVLAAGAVHEETSVSGVRMRAWDETEAARYVGSGAPLDKAGSYGVQDAGFQPVASIEGCRCNVIGLPLWVVCRLLSAAGGVPPRRPDAVRPECAACVVTGRG